MKKLEIEEGFLSIIVYGSSVSRAGANLQHGEEWGKHGLSHATHIDAHDYTFHTDECDDDPLQAVRLLTLQHFHEKLGVLLDQIEFKDNLVVSFVDFKLVLAEKISQKQHVREACCHILLEDFSWTYL